MPRRSSGGRSAPRPRPAARAPVRNPPKPVAQAPTSAPLQSRNGPATGGLVDAVADGLAFGTGIAVAHRAIDAVMSPRLIHHDIVAPSSPTATPPTTSNLGGANACGGQFKAFQDCLNNYGSDTSKCQFYMDMLQECRRSSSSTGLRA